LGEDALGVSAMGGLFYLMLTVLSFGFGTGSQILISRKVGENKPEEVGDLFSHNLIILTVYGIVAFLFMQISAVYMMPKFIHSTVILTMSQSFLSYRSWGIFFTIYISAFNALYIGLGRTKIIMYSTLVTAVLNIFLDYALIFGHFGLPQMKTDGAAIASIIAEFVGLLIMAVNVWLHQYHIMYKMKLFKKYSITTFNRLIKLSLPLVIQYSFSFGAWYLFFIVIEHMGETQIAISNIMRSILFLFTISCWAIGSSCNSIVSNKIGQKKISEVKITIANACSLSFLISLLFALILWFAPQLVMQIYTDKDVLINGAIIPIQVMGGSILLLSFSTVMFQGVQGTGSTLFNLMAELLSVLFYIVYVFVFVKPYQLSLIWAWGSEYVYWFVLLLCSYWYLKSDRWMNKQI
jgi:putative MATE family efflux protein